LRRGIVSVFTLPIALTHLFRYRFGKGGLAGLHQRLFHSILKGLKQSLLEKESDLFLKNHLLEMVSPSVAKQITKQSSILSSSPNFLVSKIAAHFGVELFAGTEYDTDLDGNLKKIRSLVDGNEKLRIAQEWCRKQNILPKDVCAWSDSVDDLPLLDWAGKVIAVRPTNKLKKIALKNKWQIWIED
jgi:phosphoserine phosphatase